MSLAELIGRATGKPPGGYRMGDKVSFNGAIGTVIATTAANGFPLQVLFMGPKLVVGFFEDGRFLDWHKESSLRFLGRQKRKANGAIDLGRNVVEKAANAGAESSAATPSGEDSSVSSEAPASEVSEVSPPSSR